MNCKPDQLCRVLRGANAQRIVRTLYRCGCLTDKMIAHVGDGMWTCEALQSMDTSPYQAPEGMGDLKTVPPGTEICEQDSNLKPLGDEGPEDMTVSDELKKFADKETRKVIPLVWNPEGEKV